MGWRVQQCTQIICSDRHDPSWRAGIICSVLLTPATVHTSKGRLVPFASSRWYISRHRVASSVLAGARIACRLDGFTFITAIFNGLGTFLKHWFCALAPRIIREHANGTTWKLASVPWAGLDKQQSSAREVVCHRISPQASGVMDSLARILSWPAVYHTRHITRSSLVIPMYASHETCKCTHDSLLWPSPRTCHATSWGLGLRGSQLRLESERHARGFIPA